jgi:hydrogenase maturation protein HypF
MVIETLPLFNTFFEHLKGKDLSVKNKADLGYSMVSSVLEKMVLVASEKAKELNIQYIGLTGGVAYDIPIVRIMKSEIEKQNLKPLFHNNVPCGDGGISVGQNAIAGNLSSK